MMNNIDPKILEMLRSQMGNEQVQPTEAEMIPPTEQDPSEDSPYAKQVQDVRNSPEYQAKMEAQKQKIAEFKAAQGQAPVESQAAPMEPQAPTEDPRLTAALAQQSKQRQYSDLLRGFQQMVAAGGGIKADYSMADIMNQRADEPVNQYKAKVAQEAAAKKEGRETQEFDLRMKKLNLDFTDMEANRDPKSEQSKIAQDRVLEVRAKMGQPVNEASVRQQSGEQLFKMFDFLKQDLAQHYQNQNNEASRQQQDRMQDKSIAADKEKFEMQQKIKAQEKEEDAKGDESKLDKKEQVQIRKEDRKLRGELNKAETSLESTIKNLEAVKTQFDKYSKGSITGTGPIATGFGLSKYINENTETLDSTFKKIALDDMVKMFAGMSKAVDSDAERRAFEATQPNIALDDKSNYKILNDKINAAKSLLSKTQAAKNKFDKTESFDDQTNNQKTVVKKGYNPKTNQTQLIYSDDSKEIVEGQK